MPGIQPRQASKSREILNEEPHTAIGPAMNFTTLGYAARCFDETFGSMVYPYHTENTVRTALFLPEAAFK
jgi:hypothetical protein